MERRAFEHSGVCPTGKEGVAPFDLHPQKREKRMDKLDGLDGR